MGRKPSTITTKQKYVDTGEIDYNSHREHKDEVYTTVGFRIRLDDSLVLRLAGMADDMRKTKAFLVRRMVEHGLRTWEAGKK